jgi:hypothetical protein
MCLLATATFIPHSPCLGVTICFVQIVGDLSLVCVSAHADVVNANLHCVGAVKKFVRTFVSDVQIQAVRLALKKFAATYVICLAVQHVQKNASVASKRYVTSVQNAVFTVEMQFVKNVRHIVKFVTYEFAHVSKRQNSTYHAPKNAQGAFSQSVHFVANQHMEAVKFYVPDAFNAKNRVSWKAVSKKPKL